MPNCVFKNEKILSSLSCNCIENIYRSSRPMVFCKKGVLINFEKFTRKHFYQSLFFNKVAGLRPAVLLKKEALAKVFSYEFFGIFKNTSSIFFQKIQCKETFKLTIKLSILSCIISFQQIFMSFLKSDFPN